MEKSGFIPLENDIPSEEYLGNTLVETSMDHLQDIGKEKVSALKESIEEIEEMIEEREELSSDIFKEGEKVKMELDNTIAKKDSPAAKDIDEQREVAGLRQKKVDIAELQLNERITCWKDIALLKKELREKQRELKEKESRLNMIGNILE